MLKRVLLFIGMLLILGFTGTTAVDKKAGDSEAKRIAISKAQWPSDLQRKLREKILVDDQVGKRGIKSVKQTAVARVDTIFMDDFEGGQPNWQATATWGNTPQGGGLANEDSSDWGLSTSNFNSPTTSWHEDGVTFLRTDMLLSPVFRLPTTTTSGEPLVTVQLLFALDWDRVAGRLVYYSGLAEVLWAFDTGNPGTGTSSWLCSVPDASPYQIFLKQFLTTPDIDLTTATAPVTLTFQYRSFSEPDFDYNNVDVSTDNFVSYLNVACFANTVDTAWTTVTPISLDAYIGSTVKLRFSHNGDFGTVEPSTLFALDEIDVSDAGGTIFSDDGGDTPTSMVASGFTPGLNVGFPLIGSPNPTPNWETIDAGVNLLDGSDGLVSPGDSIRIGFLYRVANTTPPGRGLYVDDVVVTGSSRHLDDLAAVNLEVPDPIQVGVPAIFGLNVENVGINTQTGFSWLGRIFDSTGTEVAFESGSFSGSLGPDSTVLSPPGMFSPLWTPSAPGMYSLSASVNLINDGDRSNDTIEVSLSVLLTGVGEEAEFPTVYSLGNNYPNPFNPSTVISYAVPKQSSVSLNIYSVLGQEVATLVDEVKSAGHYTVQWNGTNQFGSEVASGVYLYLFEAKAVDGSDTFRESKKMLLVE